MGKILGICTSEKRGTEKHEIQEANLLRIGESKEMPTVGNGTDR